MGQVRWTVNHAHTKILLQMTGIGIILCFLYCTYDLETLALRGQYDLQQYVYSCHLHNCACYVEYFVRTLRMVKLLCTIVNL